MWCFQVEGYSVLRRRANNVAVMVRELDSKSKLVQLLERGLSILN